MHRRQALVLLALTVLVLGIVPAGWARAEGEDFTIVVLPDTQYYSQSYPATYTAQTQWIVDTRAALNIVYVAHEGDMVQTYSSTTQWENAHAAMSVLENPATTGLADGIPYGVLPGNHDQPTENYNIYFGAPRFAGRAYYGDHYGTDNDNNYGLFSAGDIDFMVINMEYSPSSDVLIWANDLLENHSERRAIVVSHYILNSDGSFSSIGQAIYNALKGNENLLLMLCGHIHSEARRSDRYNGHTVHTLLADYQGLPNGGSGYLRTLTFSPVSNQIQVQTYSPTLDQYQTDDNSQFVLSWWETQYSYFFPLIVKDTE